MDWKDKNFYKAQNIFEEGKNTASCMKCGTNWKTYDIPKQCPFCKSNQIMVVKD